MKLLKRLIQRSEPVLAVAPDLVFASTAALERALDGTTETFDRYYFSLYHCPPEEENNFNAYRRQVSESHPDSSVPVGKHFVLWGKAAFQVVSHYYQALAEQGSPEEFREYAQRRLLEITRRYQSSQDLPVPIDLSEGQLSADEELEFFTCLALSNRQVLLRGQR
jgi:hypothetical protein